MWLGNERKEFNPGTLIVIPNGTGHGGTLVTSAAGQGDRDQDPATGTDRVFMD